MQHLIIAKNDKIFPSNDLQINQNITSENTEKIKLERKQEITNLGLFKHTSGQLGNIVYGAVKIDGRIVIQVASGISINQDSQPNKTPINTRVITIENTLQEVVKRKIPPNQLEVHNSILNNETVIVISRKDHSQEWILMTITQAESNLYGLPISELAIILSNVIKEALNTAWIERQPKFLIRQSFIALGIIILIFFSSWLFIYVGKYLSPKKSESQSMLWNSKLIQVAQTIIWLPGIGWILQLFPYTRNTGIWFLENSITISFIIIIFLFTSRILDLFIKISEHSQKLKTIPIRVFVQIFYVVLVVSFLLIIIANLFQQPLTNILAGFGTGSAIMMLIFKDTIMGFTAGIQLAANRMLTLGDWIEMPKYGADGSVIELSLYTVKVQNWDKTTTLIPTYALISDSFKNWRSMSESGGRRIKRSIFIDINSIKFCDEKMLNRFSKINFIKDYIEEKYQELNIYNNQTNIIANEVFNNQKWITNIGIFRAYVVNFLKAHPKISDSHTFLVRQLQPTAYGLPIEIYVFSSDTRWAYYETIQADIFDHLLSIIHEFDLKVFQNVSGYDLQQSNFN